MEEEAPSDDERVLLPGVAAAAALSANVVADVKSDGMQAESQNIHAPCNNCKNMDQNVNTMKAALGAMDRVVTRYCALKKEIEAIKRELEERTRQCDVYKSQLASSHEQCVKAVAEAALLKEQTADLQKKLLSSAETSGQLRSEAQIYKNMRSTHEEEKRTLMREISELKGKNESMCRKDNESCAKLMVLQAEATKTAQSEDALKKQLGQANTAIQNWRRKIQDSLSLNRIFGLSMSIKALMMIFLGCPAFSEKLRHVADFQ
ncbi:unnamed protein product [Soboliphyme baturini]|uniref:Uncharacterized protein n=1 Tax=Soboliphyme baturini TaxID=241478 RepID=A0A183J3R0_9BILA|nr:unnamed protein product [Soboliphyme baturini]